MSQRPSTDGAGSAGGRLTRFSRFQSELLTRIEAAEYLGVTPETLAVWHCTKRYPIPVVKIGKLCKYRKADLDAFIESRVIGA